MPRGPKPKTIRMHKAEGTFVPSRHKSAAPVGTEPEAKLPARPASLTGDAKKFWDKSIVELEQLGVLTKIDLPLLETLCETYGLYKAALKQAKQFPLMQEARMAWKTYAEQFNKLLAECGLTPVSRARMKIGAAEKKTVVSSRTRGAM